MLVRRLPGRQNCAAEWGCCPEHGGTLSGTGGRCRCTAPGCGRSWDWGLMGLPCPEEAAFRVRDREGKEMLLCAGHTIDARRRLVGAVVLPMERSLEAER